MTAYYTNIEAEARTRCERQNRAGTEYVLVAEADGNRTRQRRGTPLTGFEDQGNHQESRRLRR